MSDKPKLRLQDHSVLILWQGRVMLSYLGRNADDAQEFAAALRVQVGTHAQPAPHLRAEWGTNSRAWLFIDEPPTELRHPDLED